jgi:L-lactate dehydrogenase complex protein LldG
MPIDDNTQSRDAVLARVRAALGRRGNDESARAAAAHAYIAAHRQGPRPRPATDAVGRFVTRAGDMESTVERVATLDDVAPAIGRYVLALNATCADPEQDPHAGVCWPEFGWLDWKAAGITIESRPTVGHDALGVTGCYCAVAETGTLVFVTGGETPTGTFLLPETHIAIVRADQIVPGMEDAFARIRAEYASAWPRAINFVSGPSRTGDIEQTIVLGAHGPRRLHIVLVG